MKLTRVGVLSVTKVALWSGLLYGVLIGLLYGNAMAWVQAGYMSASGSAGDEVQVYRWATVGAWVAGCALLAGLGGLLNGLVGSLFLNLVLRITGGVELELEPGRGD